VYDTDGLSGGLSAAFPNAFPPLEFDEISPCAYDRSGCTREVFLEHVAKRRLVYLPNTTPGYSNAGFALLGLILESVTGAPYAEALDNLLVDPLKLHATTVTPPQDSSRGVIVGNEAASRWTMTLDGAGIGMGAAFSSVNDMSAIGRAILSSSLLSAKTTRTWMKPTSETSSLIGAVGQPWEIFRATLGPDENNRVIDLYTKGGNIGGFGANFVLIPDFDVGFMISMAGGRGIVPFELSGIIVDHLLPALEEAARMEADELFAGTYRATNGVNSSLSLTTTPGVPGLTIESWVSNGTDIVREVFRSPPSFQMYPTNVKYNDDSEQSWRYSYISIGDVGPFSACPSWVAVDRPAYGVYGLDEFVFHLNGDGKATAVEPKALKITLERE
jgi:hypothetical protein